MAQRILIVDDEPQIREVIGLFFEQKGYLISRAGNSEECLERVSADNPDLVVLDVNLGREDGLKLLGRIKTLMPALRVVMLTGLGFDDALLREALQNGADGYVSKILPLDELLNAILRVLPGAA